MQGQLQAITAQQAKDACERFMNMPDKVAYSKEGALIASEMFEVLVDLEKCYLQTQFACDISPLMQRVTKVLNKATK